MAMDDAESCGSRVMDSSPNPRQQRLKLEVYNEVLSRLRDSDIEETNLPGFEDELWHHFNRLPARYALDVNVERAEDVLTHKRLLKLAHDPATRPAIEVRLVQVTPFSDGDLTDSSQSNSSNNEDAESSLNYPTRKSIHPPPAFGSSPNLEDITLEANKSRVQEGDSTENSLDFSRPMHEITFSAEDKPKLLSQLTSLLAENGLNIREAHVFSTVDGYSLDVFVVDGWAYEEIELLKETLENEIWKIEVAASGRPWCSSDNGLKFQQQGRFLISDFYHLSKHGGKYEQSSLDEMALEVCDGEGSSVEKGGGYEVEQGDWLSRNSRMPYGVSLWRNIAKLIDGSVTELLRWLFQIFSVSVVIEKDGSQTSLPKMGTLGISISEDLPSLVSITDLSSVGNSAEEDSICWVNDKHGTFSLRKCYDILRTRGIEAADRQLTWKMIWCLLIPPKVSGLAWGDHSGRVATRDQLRHRGVEVSKDCVCSSEGMETCNHLFLHGTMAQSIWGSVIAATGIVWVMPISFEALVRSWK